MTTLEPLVSDTDIYGIVESVCHDDSHVNVWDAHRIMIALRDEYEAARLAPPPAHRSESGVGWGLLKGRIRTKGVPEPSKLGPAFHDALQMATSDDLLWALDLLIKHPNVRRTWRNYRIKHIDARLREIMATLEAQP